MHRDGAPINANYVAGTRHLDEACAPRSPRESGYPYDDWAAVREAYLADRRARRRRRFEGTDWTEAVVTRNAGRAGEDVEPTPMAPARPTNRGCLSQRAAWCLATRAGYDAEAILRYFYGDDVELSRPLGPPPPDPLEFLEREGGTGDDEVGEPTSRAPVDSPMKPEPLDPRVSLQQTHGR